MPYELGNFSRGNKKRNTNLFVKRTYILSGVKYFPVQRHLIICFVVAYMVLSISHISEKKKCRRGRKDEGIGLNQKIV